MNKRRLQRLATMLCEVPINKFNMDHWAKKQNCGTTACALGYAGMFKPFRKAGLVTDFRDEQDGTVVFTDKRRNEVTYNGRAAQMFFDLSHEEVNEIFMPSLYDVVRITPKIVARRIRKMLDR